MNILIVSADIAFLKNECFLHSVGYPSLDIQQSLVYALGVQRRLEYEYQTKVYYYFKIIL
jgi:hypothetical protein